LVVVDSELSTYRIESLIGYICKPRFYKVATLREIVSALTFIGVVFHEYGHKLFCDLTGVKVIKVRYFRFGNPAGYVIHERPKKFLQSFFVVMGPFITGVVFSLTFYFISKSFSWQEWPKYLFIWLGASVAMNSFPSNQDASNLWKDANRHITKSFFAVLGYPFVFVIWIANSLQIFWIDLIYAGFLYYWVDRF